MGGIHAPLWDCENESREQRVSAVFQAMNGNRETKHLVGGAGASRGGRREMRVWVVCLSAFLRLNGPGKQLESP